MKTKLLLSIAALALLVGCKVAPKVDDVALDEVVLAISACEALQMPLQRVIIAREGDKVTIVAKCSDSVSVVVVIKTPERAKGWKDES